MQKVLFVHSFYIVVIKNQTKPNIRSISSFLFQYE